MSNDEIAEAAAPLRGIADRVAASRTTLQIEQVRDGSRHGADTLAAGVTGSLVATPLERKGSVVGVI